jgi:hypothetical protein
MNKEDIYFMAKQVGIDSVEQYDSDTSPLELLEAFAKLVAQHEREACAKLVQDSWMAFSRAPNSRLDITPFPELEYVAKIIRARNK